MEVITSASGANGTVRKPLVSVVIPFFNAERFFEEAIGSVFAQSYRRWELLLVDDGSSDASTVIARRYAERHRDRVRYLEHPGHANRGAASARNLGVRHARGEYVAFLDADDVWLPQKLEQQVELLERHPEAGMICGASLYWYSWTGRPGDAARDKMVAVGAPQDTLVQPPELLTILHPLGNGAAPCVASLLVRRHVIEAVGGFDSSFHGIYQLYEDQVFLSKIYLAAPVLVSSICADRYRQHTASCMSWVGDTGQYHIIRKRFLEWFESYLLEKGERDAAVWHLLQLALEPYRRPARFFVREFRRNPSAKLKSVTKGIGRRVIPASVYVWLKAQRHRPSDPSYDRSADR